MANGYNNVVKASENGQSSVIGFLEKNKRDTEDLLKALSVKSNEFNAEMCFDELSKYLKSYDRLMYAPISNAIYLLYKNEPNNDLDGTLITNVESLATYIDDSKSFDNENDKKKFVNAVTKLWDHINLASQQYLSLKQTDKEFNEKFEKNFKDKFGSYKEEIMRDMNSQLLTMVSIFTALAFLIFGSISSLDNVFSVNNIPLLKVMISSLVWGLCVLNLVFIFLYCVSKMTNLKIDTNGNGTNRVCKKYPLVCWVNFLLFSILICCVWGYFLQANGVAKWFNSTDMTKLALIGSCVVVLLISLLGFVIYKCTRNYSKKDYKR